MEGHALTHPILPSPFLVCPRDGGTIIILPPAVCLSVRLSLDLPLIPYPAVQLSPHILPPFLGSFARVERIDEGQDVVQGQDSSGISFHSQGLHATIPVLDLPALRVRSRCLPPVCPVPRPGRPAGLIHFPARASTTFLVSPCFLLLLHIHASQSEVTVFPFFLFSNIKKMKISFWSLDC